MSLRVGTVVMTKERGTVPIETCQVGERLTHGFGW